MAKRKDNPNNSTVSASVNNDVWDWIEKTRSEESRRGFVRRIIEKAKSEGFE